MTWLVETQKNRPSEDVATKLKIKRADLEDQIRALSWVPVGKSNAAAKGRLEDMAKLASQILSIDRKLGRT